MNVECLTLRIDYFVIVKITYTQMKVFWQKCKNYHRLLVVKFDWTLMLLLIDLKFWLQLLFIAVFQTKLLRLLEYDSVHILLLVKVNIFRLSYKQTIELKQCFMRPSLTDHWARACQFIFRIVPTKGFRASTYVWRTMCFILEYPF